MQRVFHAFLPTLILQPPLSLIRTELVLVLVLVLSNLVLLNSRLFHAAQYYSEELSPGSRPCATLDFFKAISLA